jgi:hypothetical protein
LACPWQAYNSFRPACCNDGYAGSTALYTAVAHPAFKAYVGDCSAAAPARAPPSASPVAKAVATAGAPAAAATTAAATTAAVAAASAATTPAAAGKTAAAAAATPAGAGLSSGSALVGVRHGARPLQVVALLLVALALAGFAF